VCPVCAGDWSTCEQPCSRTFKLARGERLVDVDASGRIGLVASSGGSLRALELRGPRWVETDVQLETPPQLSATRVTVTRAPGTETHQPLPKKVISCAFVDEAHDLLASASWGELVVHRMVGGALEQVCYLTTTGAVEWVAIAFPYLAALVRGGAEDGLLLWRISNQPAYPSMLMHLAERVRVAALSRDGRYLAAAFDDHRVFVRDIDGGGNVTFDDHAATVTLLRFVGADYQLVTTDDKGRVVLRTHGASGYLRELVEVPIRS
jgi:hypothetical protein